MDLLAQELPFALRALRRRPAFTFVAVTTLALGIGANSAIFSVVNGVLLRPLPFPEPERLLMVWKYDMDGEPGRSGMSKPDLEDIADLPAVASVEGYSTTSVALTGGDTPQQVGAASVTGGLLEILGAAPHLGRDLRHDESVPDAPRVVLVGHGFWHDRLGGRPDVIGSTLEISEETYEIVGVAPPGLEFPGDARLWIPIRLGQDCGRDCHLLRAVMRLSPGVTAARLGSELTALATRLSEAYPDSNHRKGFHAEALMDYRVGDARRGLWLLLGAVGVVLLIACANVANLLLVRGSGRKSEVAVRAALGAGPRRLTAGVLSESAVLAAAGTAAGLALAWLAVSGLRGVPQDIVPRIDEVALDGRVLAFTAGLGGLATLVFGAAPALQLARSAPARQLRSGGAGRDRGEARSRSLLLATEIALSVVLLAGAGLFLRSLAELRSVEMGFSEREVTRFMVSLPDTRYGTLPEVHDFFRRVEGQLVSLPAVEAVGSAFGPPLGRNSIHAGVKIEGRPDPRPGEKTVASVHTATPGYFETLGIPVLEGRGIELTDLPESERVAVVSESFVRENLPGRSPLGERVDVTMNFTGFETTEWWRVVGVVPDVRRTPTSEFEAEIYFPHAQFGPEFLTVHVRRSTGAAELVDAAREIVASLDPNVPLSRVETLEQALGRATATTRFYLTLVGIFAGLAVVLVAVGLYGVVSYLVARRTREIGVRVALGAGAGRVRRMVVLQGLRPAVVGLMVGVGGVLAAGGVVEELLHGVAPDDLLVLTAAAALLLGVTVLATVVPARRATRVDPCEALRVE